MTSTRPVRVATALALTATLAACGGGSGPSGPPTIDAQPRSTEVGYGDPVTLSVAASGGAVSYQWRRDGQPIAGAVDARYTIARPKLSDNGAVYSAVVSNEAGSVTSDPVSITVVLSMRDTAPPTIAVGTIHALAARADGSVVAWGSNPYGELGDGPLLTDPQAGVEARRALYRGIGVAAAGDASLVLDEDGRVGAWQPRFAFDAGTGQRVERPFIDTVFPTGIVAIGAGAGVTLALRRDGTVWMNPGTSTQVAPSTWRSDAVRVPSLDGVVSLRGASGGSGRPVVVREDGTVWRIDPILSSSAPGSATATRVPVIDDARIATCGADHCLAIRADGTVAAWGDNDFGQLGDGGTAASATPVAVAGLSGVTAIAVSYLSSHAATADGRVWSWGYAPGLGLGTAPGGGQRVPVVASTFTDVRELAANDTDIVARRADGSVWSWGPNPARIRGDAPVPSGASPVTLGATSLR